MIWGIRSADVPVYAGKLAPFLINFADRSYARTTALELLESVMKGEMQAYVVDDFRAVCLTSVHQEHVEINCCAGSDREDWQDELEAHMAAWAKATGKKRVIMLTRPGWSRWAKTKGYRIAHLELVRELGDGQETDDNAKS